MDGAEGRVKEREIGGKRTLSHSSSVRPSRSPKRENFVHPCVKETAVSILYISGFHFACLFICFRTLVLNMNCIKHGWMAGILVQLGATIGS